MGMIEADKKTNLIEIRAFGLQRSGNHAILSWIQGQHKKKSTCFLNNVKHGNFDPYQYHGQKFLTGIDEKVDRETLREIDKDLLIYSYEDCLLAGMNKNKDFLSSVFDKDFENNREHYLGKSKHKFDILIIRDPFNFFASRLKRLNERTGIKDPKVIANNWKILAREALDLITYPKPQKIVVNYNRWVNDQTYRKELSQLLQGTFDDAPINSVSQIGKGSSFDEYAYERLPPSRIISNWTKLLEPERYTRLGYYLKRITAPKPQKMKVTERWKMFVNDEAFREIFTDPEILELSEEIFGEISGTREFVQTLKPSKSY